MSVEPGSQPLVTVGRVVHYCSNGTERAAIVTLVKSDKTVNLTVFDSQGGTYGVFGIQYNEQKQHNTWSWPPRV